MKSRPVKLIPSFREKVWGVTDLSPWFPESTGKIGEVWFLQPEPGPQPILVKFIFNSELLSVQVHPEDSYALAHDGIPGKTEMWHILRAEPGAKLALGFRQPVTRERLREAAVSGEIESLLQWFTVSPGETYFIPPGSVHALGAGVTLCEIQQNSDITYRLYDYGRPRELHLDKAVDVASLGAHPGASKPEGGVLASCPYFVTEEAGFTGSTEYKPETDRFHVLVFLNGAGTIAGEPFQAGEVWHIPEGGSPFTLEVNGTARVLRVTQPRGC